MSQLNVYVPDDLAKEIRHKARESGESISRFLSRLFRKEVGKKKGWDKNFFTKIVGGWKGELSEVERSGPEERDFL
ncbi:MAG: ribbon-helix-helix protein, CopG family [Deltaproteobacteria bacterium]|nr:ribbon-helix-helix protein, CopG family [Deltaproteobacteria bacterium]